MAAARANLVSSSFCFLADFANEKSVEPKVYAEKSITDGTASLTKNDVFFLPSVLVHHRCLLFCNRHPQNDHCTLADLADGGDANFSFCSHLFCCDSFVGSLWKVFSLHL